MGFQEHLSYNFTCFPTNKGINYSEKVNTEERFRLVAKPHTSVQKSLDGNLEGNQYNYFCEKIDSELITKRNRGRKRTTVDGQLWTENTLRLPVMFILGPCSHSFDLHRLICQKNLLEFLKFCQEKIFKLLNHIHNAVGGSCNKDHFVVMKRL